MIGHPAGAGLTGSDEFIAPILLRLWASFAWLQLIVSIELSVWNPHVNPDGAHQKKGAPSSRVTPLFFHSLPPAQKLA
jgi:hypothetical protein